MPCLQFADKKLIKNNKVEEFWEALRKAMSAL